jgi:hypothetical protein
MARACASCGYILPFALRQHRLARETSAPLPVATAPPAPEPAAATSGATDADPAVGARDWSMPDISAEPMDADATGATVAEPPVSLPQTPPAPPPGPPALVENEPPAWVARLTGAPMALGSAPSELPPLPPLPPLAPDAAVGPDTAGTIPAGPVPDPALGALPPFLPHELDALTGTGAPTPLGHGAGLDQQFLAGSTMVMSALNAGTLLKGGRYRLLQRFSSATITGRRGELEPPLYLASDALKPSVRVLVQELPLADLPPDAAEHLQRRAATRLELAGRQTQASTLVDSFSEHGRRFLVTQLPGGERLGDRLRREGAQPEAEVIRIGIQALDILATLSQAAAPLGPITHGNIAPDNILLQPDGQVTLVGFSPALLLRGSGWPDRGMVGGARGYAAPEQQRGQADTRTDIYSLAAVMHYAVTGSDPTERTSVIYDPARRVNPAVSPELEALLAQALRPAPAQRFQTVEEMRRALAPLQPEALRSPARARERDARGKKTARGRVSVVRLPGPVGALRAEMDRAPKTGWSARWLSVALVVCALLGGVGSGLAYLALPRTHTNVTSIPTVPSAQDRAAAALYQQKGIGLSDGRFIFETQRPDGDLKRQAAQALAGQRLRTARDAFQQAVIVDQADAEAAIYAADATLALANDPVVTLVVGVAFGADSATTAASASELQGVYLAQQRINTLGLLPGATHLRVLIANSGARPDGATTVAGLVAAAVAGGNPQHIVGVVGWLEAAQTHLGLAALAGTGVPVVAPAMADPALTSSAYFALAPSLAQEGAALADGAVTALHSQRALVLNDPTDTDSATLAQAFVTQAQQQDAAFLTITGQEAYTKGRTSDFTPFVQDALNAGDDTIFIAGTDLDVAYLARAVAQVWPAYLPAPHILAGSPADTPALLGAGTSPAAQVVRGQAAAMAAVNVVALADMGEWTAAGVPEGAQPSLATDYTGQFGPAAAPGGLGGPDVTAVLAYDAARLLGRAVTAATQGTTLPAPKAVLAVLAGARPGRAFQGVSGAIAFQGSGAPINKALALLALTPVSGKPAAGGPALTTRVVAVLGGVAAFCGGASCPAV